MNVVLRSLLVLSCVLCISCNVQSKAIKANAAASGGAKEPLREKTLVVGAGPVTVDTPTRAAIVSSTFLAAGSCSTPSTITVSVANYKDDVRCNHGRWSRTVSLPQLGFYDLVVTSSLAPAAPISRTVVRRDGVNSQFTNHALFQNQLAPDPFTAASDSVAQFKIEPDASLNQYYLERKCRPNQKFPFHERELYWMSMERTAGPSTPYKLRVSRGGAALHGIFLPNTGNMVGDDELTGIGMDRVYETTIALQRPRPGSYTAHIHGGGSYSDGSGNFCDDARRNPDGSVRTRPFWSPILSYEATATGKLRTLSWPQASEVYQSTPGVGTFNSNLAPYNSDVLLETIYTDIGTIDGASVVQVDVVAMNYGDDNFADITAPWFGGVRKLRQTGTALELGFGRPGGFDILDVDDPSTPNVPNDGPAGKGGSEAMSKTNRLGFLAQLYGNTALSMVYGAFAGTTATFAPGSTVHFTDTLPNSQYSGNFNIIAAAFRGNSAGVLAKNEIATIRSFLTFGDRAASYSADARLAPYAGFNKRSFDANPGHEIELCYALGFSGCADVHATNVPTESAARPIYVMRDPSGREFLGTDPYCKTRDPGDGKATVVRLGGWTVKPGAGRVALSSLPGVDGGCVRATDAVILVSTSAPTATPVPTAAPTTAPAPAPQPGVQIAPPTQFVVAATGPTTATLSWTRSYTGETGVRVEIGPGGRFIDYGPDATPVTITGLTAGAVHTFRMRSWKTGDIFSGLTSTVTITMPNQSTSRFGALAYSNSTGYSGWVWGWQDRASAEAKARELCSQGDCAVLISLQDSCGALALGPGGSGWISGAASKALAIQGALATCRSYASGECSIQAAFCSSGGDYP